MGFLSEFIMSIGELLLSLLSVYRYIIIIAVLITWVSPDPYNPIVRTLQMITLPVFRFVRQHLPAKLREIPIDISPILVLLGITVLKSLIINVMKSMYIH